MTTLAPTTPATTPRDPRRWWGLGVLSLSLLVVVMDMTILNVALPAISTDLRPSSTQLLWMVDTYSLVLAGLLVTASAAGDRWGHRRVLMTGYVVFAVASLAVLLVDSPAGVIAVRALLGTGGAMIMPATLSIIRHLFTDVRERAFALGVWGAMAAVGSAVGPVVGGALLEFFAWQAAFLVNVPVMAVALVGAALLLPRSRARVRARWDAPATAASIVGMVALVYAIKELAKYGLTTDGALASLVAVVALTWFVRRCLRAPHPMLQLRLFRRPSFTAGILTAMATTIALAAVLLLGAQWLQLVRDLSPLQAGVALLPAAVGGAVASPLAPKVAELLGARAVLAGGLGLGAAGLALVGLSPELTYPVFAVALGLVGVGTGSLAYASAVIMSSATTDEAGSAAALEETSYEVGTTLGVAVLGSIAAAAYRGALPDAAPAARESLAGAIETAAGLGAEGPALLATAQVAFTDSLATAGLAGAIVMGLAALVVAVLTPRDLDLGDLTH